MNKKEQSEFEQLKTALALRFTEKTLPDLAPPKDYGLLIKGYSFNSYSMQVSVACTGSNMHNSNNDDRTTTRGAIHLYSNEMAAWKAMRNQVEDECALRLRRIDVQIEILDAIKGDTL